MFGPRFFLQYTPGAFNANTAFDRSAPLFMEVGFGMGSATAHIAQLRPQDSFICCEVHEPGVGSLLNKADFSLGVPVASGSVAECLHAWVNAWALTASSQVTQCFSAAATGESRGRPPLECGAFPG